MARISIIVAFACKKLAAFRHHPPKKYWEIIGDKLSAAGWSWGYCSAVTPNGWRWDSLELEAALLRIGCVAAESAGQR
jgi:hypothetical protein